MNSTVERAATASRAPHRRRTGPLGSRHRSRTATAARTTGAAQACACGHQNQSTYATSWAVVCPVDLADDEYEKYLAKLPGQCSASSMTIGSAKTALMAATGIQTRGRGGETRDRSISGFSALARSRQRRHRTAVSAAAASTGTKSRKGA